MRIGMNFHTFDRYISGVEYYCLGLIRALVHTAGSNDYVVFTNSGDIVAEHVGRADNLSVVDVACARSRPGRILWEHVELPAAASHAVVDVLHCMSYLCPLRACPVPYVVTVHDTIAIDHPQWCKLTNALYFRLCMKRALRKASRVIAVSRCTANDIRRNFEIDSSKVRVVYPGVDDIFRATEDVERFEEVRLRYGLPERYVLYVGNIEPKKNIKALLSSVRRIREKGLEHKLVIAGKRTWGSRNELSAIGAYVDSGDVVLAGYVVRKDLACVYKMADVFVFPSLYEGFGFPPLEAMACGTAVIASNRGALAETLGNAAIMVDAEDAEAIAEAIVRVVGDGCLREKHIQMGLEQSALLRWDKAAKETLFVYEEAAGCNGQR